MDLRQLKCFVAVAEQEKFSRVTQQLYVAHSALSRRMRDLEEQLGVRLFDRHLRGAAHPPEGRDLLERAGWLLRGVDQLRSDVAGPRALPSGPVGVGMTPNFASVARAALAAKVRERYPQARLRIVEAYSPELREMVRSSAIDLAVLSANAPVLAAHARAGGHAARGDRTPEQGDHGDPGPLGNRGALRQRRHRGVAVHAAADAGRGAGRTNKWGKVIREARIEAQRRRPACN